jgi:hypothetical protein
MLAAVGCLPAKRMAGSPGGSLKKMKYVKKVMMSRTRTIQSRRRMM